MYKYEKQNSFKQTQGDRINLRWWMGEGSELVEAEVEADRFRSTPS